jgi:hypothetical protein
MIYLQFRAASACCKRKHDMIYLQFCIANACYKEACLFLPLVLVSSVLVCFARFSYLYVSVGISHCTMACTVCKDYL